MSIVRSYRLAISAVCFLGAVAIVGCGDDTAANEGAAGGGGSRPTASGSGGDGAGGAGGSTTGGLGGTAEPGTPVFAEQHPKILLGDDATITALRAQLASGSPSAKRFKDMVDSQLGGSDHYNFKPWYAALMYGLSADAQYASYAIAQTDALVAAEEALIAANQRAEVAGDNYLYVGDTVGGVMLVYDWCYDKLTPEQRERWLDYANNAVTNVWDHEHAQWGDTEYPWSGWSVDNPSNNYYYSFLEATMLLGLGSHGDDPRAQAWIDKFRDDKIAAQLVPQFQSDLEGGGSREGTGYGVAMARLFKLYDWWQRSTTEDIASLTTHARGSLAFMMHSVVPTLDRIAPTGDHSRDSSAALFDYHRDYLQVLMGLYPEHRLSGVAKTLLAESSVPEMSQRFMYYSDFLNDSASIPAKPLSDLANTYYGKGTGQIMTRTSWDTSAAYMNVICGSYTESHAHRDQGSFVLYRGGWLAYDQNIASHSGILQDEEMHNLVRITQSGETVKQKYDASCNLVALADNANYTYVSADVSPLYAGNPAVTKVQREVVFLRPATFVVFDRVTTSGSGIQRIWQLNTPAKPTQTGAKVSLTSGSGALDVYRIAPASASVAVIDWKAVEPAEMTGGGYRVDLTDAAGDASIFLNVLSTGGAVSAATASDAAGQTGVVITLSDGREATVRFANDAPGGAVEVRSADDALVYEGALSPDVQALPLFTSP